MVKIINYIVMSKDSCSNAIYNLNSYQEIYLC